LTELFHAELSVATYLIGRNNEANDNEPETDTAMATKVPIKIGVFKACCLLCSKYLQTLNQMTGYEILYSNSQGKIYSGWKIPASSGMRNLLSGAAH
jgi:hypothetical protein